MFLSVIALAAALAATGAFSLFEAKASATVAAEEETGEEPGWNRREDGWYYLGADLSPQTGWLFESGSWYYLGEEGRMQTGWVLEDGEWYRLGSDGRMVTGWHYESGGWYYFRESGKMHTGWLSEDGEWYYLRQAGKMQTGWLKIDGAWYYFRESGKMHTGWLQEEESWYYLRPSGRMETGWLRLDGKWYYLRAGGQMLTGWLNFRNSWYYLGGDGSMRTGWVKDREQWYLLDDAGKMLRDGWLIRDGHSYHFAENGQMDADETKPQCLVSMPGYYISPMKAGNLNTTEERIEAMIACAYDYLEAGTKFKECRAQAPGTYADCSGLVMQCLYAAGFDPAPATPEHHALPENEYDSRTLYFRVPMKHVTEEELKRGDLIFYKSKKANIIIHVSIYLGDGKVIESWPPGVTDRYEYLQEPHPLLYGIARPFE